MTVKWIPPRVLAWFAAALFAGLVSGVIAVNKRLAPVATHGCDDPNHDHGGPEVGNEFSSISKSATVLFLSGGVLVWIDERFRVLKSKRSATQLVD